MEGKEMALYNRLSAAVFISHLRLSARSLSFIPLGTHFEHIFCSDIL